MSFIARLYARRIINVNVNVIVAGLLALVPTTYVVHLWDRNNLSQAVGLAPSVAIPALTFITDIVCDVAIYFGLHWLANHTAWCTKWTAPAYKGISFLRDATLVQFQRALLSPVLYTVALGTQGLLIHRRDTNPEWATIIGLCSGILVARSLHTLWMLREERSAARAAAIEAKERSAKVPDAFAEHHHSSIS